MPELYAAGQLAEMLSHELGRPVESREISDHVYRNRVPREKCPLVAGVRLIPAELVPQLRELLKRPRRKRGAAKVG